LQEILQLQSEFVRSQLQAFGQGYQRDRDKGGERETLSATLV
jgi:hypothetical protein